MQQLVTYKHESPPAGPAGLNLYFLKIFHETRLDKYGEHSNTHSLGINKNDNLL